jgi:hypothetical protein
MQKPGEILWEYIQCFSCQCNKLPNVTDGNVINAYTYGTTCDMLGCEPPWTTPEILDVTTKYAMGEEVVLSSFKSRGKAAAP